MRSVLWKVGLVLTLVACGDGSQLTALTPGRANVATQALNLGETLLGIPVDARVHVEHAGETGVRLEARVEPDGTAFALDAAERTLGPGGTDVVVTLVAVVEGSAAARLVLVATGEQRQEFVVQLLGKVLPPPNCDDGNPCTVDALLPEGCMHQARSGACDDGDACSESDTCVAARCVGQPKNCDDGVACTADSCQAQTGCLHEPLHRQCDDAIPCTADVCVPALGCQNAVMPNGSLCGAPLCDALSVCVNAECRTAPAPDGFPCEDGDPCSLGDACLAGACVKGPGEPMGTGDPVLAVVDGDAPNGIPLTSLGALAMAPLGNGKLRVAWLGADAEGAQHVAVNVMDGQGNLETTSLLGDGPVACAAGARVGDALWVLDVDAAGQQSRMWSVAADGSTNGPWTVAADEGPVTGCSLAGHQGDWVVALAMENTVVVRLLRVVDGAVEVQREERVVVDGLVDGLESVLLEGEAVVVWKQRHLSSAGMAMCGGVDVVGAKLRLPVAQSRERVLEDVAVQGTLLDLAVTQGGSGTALVTAFRSLGAECDGGCCGQRDGVEMLLDGEALPLLQENDDAGVRVEAVAAGTALGRPVALVMLENGTVGWMSPPLGGLPAIQASYVPGGNVPLRLDGHSRMMLEGDGAKAWLGARVTLARDAGSWAAVALVPAGCGETSTGSVRGWRFASMDAGQDSGIVDQDSGVPEQDGGIVDQDSGVPEQDSGVAEQDSGMVEQDSGMVEQDSGVPDVDGGIVDQDSGVPILDSGVATQDGGA